MIVLLQVRPFHFKTLIPFVPTVSYNDSLDGPYPPEADFANNWNGFAEVNHM